MVKPTLLNRVLANREGPTRRCLLQAEDIPKHSQRRRRATLAAGLRAVGIEATTVAELGLAGSADTDVFAAAVASGDAVLTENVGDFTRLAAEHNTAGSHHHGLLIALSSRFSRQPAGARTPIAAVKDAAEESFDDRVIYLKATGPR